MTVLVFTLAETKTGAVTKVIGSYDVRKCYIYTIDK